MKQLANRCNFQLRGGWGLAGESCRPVNPILHLYFPEIFSQRKLRIRVIWHGNRKHFTVKMQVCSLHLRKKIGLMKVFE